MGIIILVDFICFIVHILSLALCLLGNFCVLFLSSAVVFQNQLFQKNLFGIHSLAPDQAQQNVGPDLVPNCLQNRR